jgi:DNA polymerase V
VHPAATFVARVEGDSMVGAGILDGDLVIIDRALQPVPGGVVVAAIDGAWTIKHLRWDGPRTAPRNLRLEPANPAYPIIPLDRLESIDMGVVRATIHIWRRD